jgi:hypothetical protein
VAGDGPDQAAPADSNALQALVSRLRRGRAGIIEHRAGGYLLAVDPGDVDDPVRRAVGQGVRPWRRRPGSAAARALDLWRGYVVDVDDAAFA